MHGARLLCGVLALCLLTGARGTPARPVEPPAARQAPAPATSWAAAPASAASISATAPLVHVEQLSPAPALLSALQAAGPTTAGPLPAPLEAAGPSTAALGRAPAPEATTEGYHVSAEPIHAPEAAALHEVAAFASAPTQACPTRPSAHDPQPAGCLHGMLCSASYLVEAPSVPYAADSEDA